MCWTPRDFYTLGSQDDCFARLQEYVDAGARHLVIGCAPGSDNQLDDFIGSLRELLPAIRALQPTPAR